MTVTEQSDPPPPFKKADLPLTYSSKFGGWRRLSVRSTSEGGGGTFVEVHTEFTCQSAEMPTFK